MAPRRSHKKSRNGCDQCKLRRVKCDEQGPPCSNCVAREIPCSYARQANTVRAHISPDMSATNTILTNSPVAVEDAVDRLRDLELMHQYTSKTWKTFCHNQGQGLERSQREADFLQNWLPMEAIRHETFLLSLLAVAALHKASSEASPNDSPYLELALRYQSRSQALFDQAIAKVNDESCHMIFATSLGYMVFGAAAIRYFRGTEPLKPVIDEILSIRALFRGSWEILALYREPLLAGPFHDFVAPKNMSLYPACDHDTHLALQRLRSIQRSFISSNSNVMSELPVVIDELENAFRRSQSGVLIACFAWLAWSSDTFVADVRGGGFVSVLVLMHWTVLLSRSRDLWWIPKCGPALVEVLSENIRVSRTDELEALAWCRDQVRHSSVNVIN